MNPIVSAEKELEMLQQVFNLAQGITVVGARQAGILATLADTVAAVANSLNAKIQLAKQAAVEAPAAKPELALVPKTETNGEVTQGEPAPH